MRFLICLFSFFILLGCTATEKDVNMSNDDAKELTSDSSIYQEEDRTVELLIL